MPLDQSVIGKQLSATSMTVEAGRLRFFAAAIGETRRTFTVTCDGECLVYEFWTEKFLGLQKGSFQIEVDPRLAKVLALRKPNGAPQLLGTNRHITRGATEMLPIPHHTGYVKEPELINA